MKQEDFEIVDIIVMELVNEQDFQQHLVDEIIEAVGNHQAFPKLQRAIINNSNYKNHTHHLDRCLSDIQTVVAVEVLKYYWEQYRTTEFNPSTNIPSLVHHLYQQHSSKEPVLAPLKPELNHALVVIRRLKDEYAAAGKLANDKFQARINNDKWMYKALKQFENYKEGRWAWNTLKKEFARQLTNNTMYPTNEEKAAIDVFTLQLYAHFFHKLYNRLFLRTQIPPQCWYLISEPRPETEDERKRHNTMRNQTRANYENNLTMHRHLLKEAKTNSNEPKKGNTVLNIKNVTLIDGEDADTLDNDDIFSMIATIEEEIKTLEKINNKPIALTTKIIKLQDTIKKLVEISDAREPKTDESQKAAE